MPHILIENQVTPASSSEWSQWMNKNWNSGKLVQKQTKLDGHVIMTYFTGLFEDMWCTEIRAGRMTTELRNFPTLESALVWHEELLGKYGQMDLF